MPDPDRAFRADVRQGRDADLLDVARVNERAATGYRWAAVIVLWFTLALAVAFDSWPAWAAVGFGIAGAQALDGAASACAGRAKVCRYELDRRRITYGLMLADELDPEGEL